MLIDESGNKIFVDDTNIVLKLKAEGGYRTIAKLDLKNKQIICFRSSEKHLFRKGDAYGFNVKVLETATRTDKVKLIVDAKESFVIPIKDILEKGSYLNFKSVGFEKQIFVNREILKNYKEK